VLAHCGNTSCQQATTLNFESLQLIYHYQWHQSATMESSVYAGVSYMWIDGEIKGQPWRDNTTGYQVGNQFYFLTHSAIQPYIGVKLSYFAIEDADDTIHLPNLSQLFVLRFLLIFGFHYDIFSFYKLIFTLVFANGFNSL
jgi:hypothetical protein